MPPVICSGATAAIWWLACAPRPCCDGRVADEVLFRGRSSAESDVIHAVWEEIGGELVEEFVVPIIAGQLSRARHIDGVFAVDGPRRWHPARTPLALRGRDIVVCQAKAG